MNKLGPRTTLVHIRALPDHLDDFIAATRLNHEGTRKEPGNLQFDLIQMEEDPSRFVLVEVFQDEAAVNAHKQTAHYALWRDAVAPWMAEPRKGVVYHRILPA